MPKDRKRKKVSLKEILLKKELQKNHNFICKFKVKKIKKKYDRKKEEEKTLDKKIEHKIEWTILQVNSDKIVTLDQLERILNWLKLDVINCKRVQEKYRAPNGKINLEPFCKSIYKWIKQLVDRGCENEKSLWTLLRHCLQHYYPIKSKPVKKDFTNPISKKGLLSNDRLNVEYDSLLRVYGAKRKQEVHNRHVERPAWFSNLPKEHISVIRKIIGDAKRNSIELENRLIHETKAQRRNIRELLHWWFSNDFQSSLRELQLLKKRAYDHHGERFVLRPKALDLIENLQIGFHLYLLQAGYSVNDPNIIVPYQTNQIEFFRTLSTGRIPLSLLQYLKDNKTPVKFTAGRLIIQVIDFRDFGKNHIGPRLYRIGCQLSTQSELEHIVESASEKLNQAEVLELQRKYLLLTKKIVVAELPQVAQLLGYSNINYCKQNVSLYPSSTLKKCLKNHASEKWDEFKKKEEKQTTMSSQQKNVNKKRKKCSEKKAEEEKIKHKKIKWNSSEIYNYRRTNPHITKLSQPPENVPFIPSKLKPICFASKYGRLDNLSKAHSYLDSLSTRAKIKNKNVKKFPKDMPISRGPDLPLENTYLSRSEKQTLTLSEGKNGDGYIIKIATTAPEMKHVGQIYTPDLESAKTFIETREEILLNLPSYHTSSKKKIFWWKKNGPPKKHTYSSLLP